MKKFVKCFLNILIAIFLLRIMIFNDYYNGRWTIREISNSISSQMKGPLQDDNPDLIQYLHAKVLNPPSALDYNLTINRIEKIYGTHYTWPFINDCLKKLFKNQRGGFFVEAGAFNGEFLSNTLRLEKEQGWSGLLVEPEENNFQEMMTKRRKAWTAHACLSNKKYPQEVTMVSLRIRKNSDALPIMVRANSHQVEYEPMVNSTLNQRFHANMDRSFYQSQCYPLYSFLLALNVSTIDFMSLDLQGSDIEVFETLPLDKIYVRSFVIEGQMLEDLDNSLVKKLNSKGFYLFGFVSAGPDYFFINKNDPFLMKIGQNYGRFQKMIDEGQTVKLMYA